MVKGGLPEVGLIQRPSLEDAGPHGQVNRVLLVQKMHHVVIDA